MGYIITNVYFLLHKRRLYTWSLVSKNNIGLDSLYVYFSKERRNDNLEV